MAQRVKNIRERHRERAQLQTQYTMAELSEMSGLSTTQLRRLLKRRGVLLERGGKRNYIVYLHMLICKAEDFWKSILQREELRLQITSSPDPEEE